MKQYILSTYVVIGLAFPMHLFSETSPEHIKLTDEMIHFLCHEVPHIQQGMPTSMPTPHLDVVCECLTQQCMDVPSAIVEEALHEIVTCLDAAKENLGGECVTAYAEKLETYHTQLHMKKSLYRDYDFSTCDPNDIFTPSNAGSTIVLGDGCNPLLTFSPLGNYETMIVTGTAVFDNGTPNVPLLCFIGSKHTGFSVPIADTLIISTTGIGRLQIDPQGAVTISAPTGNVAALTITGHGASALQITAGTSQSALTITGVTGAPAAILTGGTGGSDTPIRLVNLQSSGLTGNLAADSSGNVFKAALSSKRYKDNIKSIDQESSAIYALNPVMFDYKPDHCSAKNVLGLIAEEVHDAAPDLNLVVLDKDGRPDNVNYQYLHALEIRELQKHQQRLDALEKQLHHKPAPSNHAHVLKSGDTMTGTLTIHTRSGNALNVIGSNASAIAIQPGLGQYALDINTPSTAVKGIRSTPTFNVPLKNGGAVLVVNSQGEIGHAPSSERFKENVRSVDAYSKKIHNLNPVLFDYKDGSADQFGFIAEEVNQHLPEVVAQDQNGQPYTINPLYLIPLMLNEIKHLKHEIKSLQQAQ